GIPHIFHMGFVYELPAGKGKKFATSGVSRWILGDWQVNSNFSSFQGRPFSVGAAQGALNAPGNAQTADLINPNVAKLGGIGTGQPFFDPTAFAAPTGVRFGTSGRNTLRGPGAVALDLALFRKFHIRAHWSVD